MPDTIIVGAGFNGMLLGALLAHDGDRITVMEKRTSVGGRALLEKRDGFMLDYGIHLTRFGPESALAAVFRRLEKPLSFHRLGKSYVAGAAEQITPFPTSPAGIAATRMFTPWEKIRILGLLLKIKSGRFDDLMKVSLKEWMEQHTITGGIRKYFELISASVMVCPFIEKTSAGELFRNLRKVLLTGHSAEYPSGGWEPIQETLVREITGHGTIATGRKVDGIILRKGAAVGVRCGQKKYPADRVVLNVPVQQVYALLPRNTLGRDLEKKCSGLLPTAGVFVDIALSSPIGDCTGLLYSYNPHVFGMITSNMEPSVAPAGKQLITMFYPTTVDDIRNPAVFRRRKEELWGAVKRFFPGIDSHVLWKREVGLTMVDGTEVNIHQTESDRPGIEVQGIRNLYLVGDSVSAPGAGGDVGNEAVLQAYRIITGREIR
jgi:phytoene dehydrogenase-like protein